MTTIQAKVIDGFHAGLEKGIPAKIGDKVFIKNIEKKPVVSLRGAWGCDVGSADFVDTLRKSRTLEPLGIFSGTSICVDMLQKNGPRIS
ncbi:MAG: hypothetical protein WC620_11395 [Methanoregula sp.]|jgi:hypothetical protein